MRRERERELTRERERAGAGTGTGTGQERKGNKPRKQERTREREKRKRDREREGEEREERTITAHSNKCNDVSPGQGSAMVFPIGFTVQQVMDRFSSSASTVSSIDDCFEHNMWNPLLELEQANGIVRLHWTSLSVERLYLVWHRCHPCDIEIFEPFLSTTAAHQLQSGDAHAFRLV